MHAGPLAVLGAINLDLVALVAHAPAAGETVADGRLSRQPGGKGANQAAAAARLGGKVRLLGAVGDDADGAGLRHTLEDAGVDTAGVQVVADPTGTALIVVDSTGENSIVVCPGANGQVAADALSLGAGEALLAQLELDDQVVEHAIRSATGYVALNVAPARALASDVMDRVDLFIANEGEYAALPALASAPLVAVTLGSRGAQLLEHGREIARAESPPTSVVNTVGAGDAFCAALTLALLRHETPARALRAACAVGAAAVADHRSQPLLQNLDSYLA